MKCPYCSNDTTDGTGVKSCLRCGVRWFDSGLKRTLEFAPSGTKWWWNDVDEGVLLVVDKFSKVVS